jgi:hypothetical protein
VKLLKRLLDKMKIVTMQIDEKLAYILEPGDNISECINRAKQVIAADVTFLPLIQWATSAEFGIVGIPEGTPETYKPQTDMPQGIADTTLRQEFRRVKNFLPNGSCANLKPYKREQLWIQLLEGIHFKEAEILTMIKDKTLLERFPNLAPIFTAIGVNITVALPKKKARNRK